jgi:hypothetical protein
MGVRRLGKWLAILAITLNAAWPLIATAKPKSVHLVPLCTVEGVTHYIELPGGTTPLDKSADAHHDHCSFCFLGMGGLLPAHTDIPLALAVAADRVTAGVEASPHSAPLFILGARAPPLSPVVTLDHHNFGRQSETDIVIGRVARAPYSGRFVRLGLLHGRYAMEHAGSHH